MSSPRGNPLLGDRPAFIPNDTEAVWNPAQHRSIYLAVNPRAIT